MVSREGEGDRRVGVWQVALRFEYKINKWNEYNKQDNIRLPILKRQQVTARSRRSQVTGQAALSLSLSLARYVQFLAATIWNISLAYLTDS